MELEKSNLNSDDRLIQQNTSSSCSWSELPPDLLTLVLERLGFADFERAKFACTSWHSASRQSVPRNLFPWLIIFPQDDDDKNNKNNACKLFNPEEKDKLYKTRDLGLEFANSVCVATCGSWLLMEDSRSNLYIVNLFTNDEKIIKLPPLDSQHGTIKVEGTFEDGFCFTNERNQRKEYKWIQIKSPVFWIDEKTKDYVVISGLQDWCVVYAKKGHTSWNQLPKTSCCFDMVYKDHKLYFSSCRRRVLRIFDFSREIPKQTFRCPLRIYRDLECKFIFRAYSKLVVTLAGDVLKVDRIIRRRFDFSTFLVYRVYSSRAFKKYERVDSLGDEAMLWNMGITVLANDKEGFKRNSIYFNGSNKEKTTETCIFNLQTRKTEPQHNFDWSSVRQVGRARWFLPSFKRECY